MQFDLRTTDKVPIFYKFRGYVWHLIVCGVRCFPGLDIKFTVQAMEKYQTLGWGEHLEFKDRVEFLAISAETPAPNPFTVGKDLFKQLSSSFQVDGVHTFTSTCCSAWECSSTSSSMNRRR